LFLAYRAKTPKEAFFQAPLDVEDDENDIFYPRRAFGEAGIERINEPSFGMT
jgi:hypothetical protein